MNTPIVAVTAYERNVQLADAFDSILSKPVTKDIISQQLKQLCRLATSAPVIEPSPSNTIAHPDHTKSLLPSIGHP